MKLSTLKSIFAKQPPLLSLAQCEGGRILIGNSFCTLKDFHPTAIEVIRKRLTYDNQETIYEVQQLKVSLAMAFRFKKHGKVGWIKSKIAQLEQNIEICWLRNNKFPTGLLFLVQEALQEFGVNIQTVDRRKNAASKVKLNWATPPLAPRYFQTEMLALGVKAGRGVFESAVGSGKTFIMQLLAHELGMPTLVVVPSKDLSIQTYDSFVQAFGASKVELINSAKSGHRKAIRICSIHTLTAFLKKGTLDLLLKGVGMICIDEVHHAGAKSYTDLLPYFDHIYYRFGFSGTFMRNDSKSLDMWGFLSTVLYRYSASQATREGFLTPLKILTHEIEGRRGSTYQREYSANYCENVALLLGIKDIFDELVGQDDQVLILVGRKDKAGKVIHEYLTELGIDASYVNGDSARDDVKQALLDFNAKRVKVLIGSSIIGEGIDVRSTDHLIMAQGGKSEIAITQALGRAARLFPGKEVAYIHDFRFTGTKYLEKHLGNRLEIYSRNFAAEIVC